MAMRWSLRFVRNRDHVQIGVRREDCFFGWPPSASTDASGLPSLKGEHAGAGRRRRSAPSAASSQPLDMLTLPVVLPPVSPLTDPVGLVYLARRHRLAGYQCRSVDADRPDARPYCAADAARQPPTR